MKSQYDWLLQETKKSNVNHEKVLTEVDDLKRVVVSQASEIRQLKDLLTKINEKLFVSDQNPSTAFVEHDIDTITSTSVPRKRDITLNFKKIVKPNNARVRTRDGVHVLLGDLKNYTKTDGTDVTEKEKAELVDNNVKRLNRLVLDVCDKMKKELDTINNNNSVVWSDIPDLMVDNYVNDIEKAAADRRFFIDRCENKWAAYGMLAEHYQNNYNPSVLKRKAETKLEKEKKKKQKKNTEEKVHESSDTDSSSESDMP